MAGIGDDIDASESNAFLDHKDVEDTDGQFNTEKVFHKPQQRDYRRIGLASVSFLLLGILIGCSIPYLMSSWLRQDNSYGGLLAPIGNVTQVWHQNVTFTQYPTPESEKAWDDLVPVGRGFIHQPEIAPFISNIAAFHQLHCLHSIMLAYYAALDSASEVEVTNESWQAEIRKMHVHHCFDYLRRTIMCYADTNLEVLDRVNRSTNGWGQPKICRDWESVFRYAERYANSTNTGIIDD